MKVLQSHGKAELPADALLKTPTELKIVEIGKGKFWYNGIEKCLTDICFSQQIPEKLSLIFNIDGMSPFNSSNLQFWPILFLIHELRDQIYPLVAAAYYGENKPPLKEYFRNLINELNFLLRNGVIINNRKVMIGIRCFVCDTPARSFIKGMFLQLN